MIKSGGARRPRNSGRVGNITGAQKKRSGPIDPVYRVALGKLRIMGEGKLPEAASVTVKGITFTVIGGKIRKSSSK